MTHGEHSWTADIVLEERPDLLQRIERYRKRYPSRDVEAYIERVKQDARLDKAKQYLLAQAHARARRIGSSCMTYIEQSLQQGRYAEEYLKGNAYPFERMLHYIENGSRIDLYCQDFREVDLPENSIDWIITDPPYPQKYLPLYRDLALFARRVLRPGGGLLAMVGQSYLPEIFQLMSVEGLKYNWTLCYLTPGGQSPQLWQRKVNTFWKPVLWFSKGENKRWIGDVVKSDVNDNDKTYHFWGQSVSGMTDLLQKVSYVGETILDPFMGGGATGAACLLHRRHFIGIEIEKGVFATAEERLRALQKAL
ncbi:MAG: DNA methyltransferase [Saprospiraceae bacterium]|nr:site-specific DNA-methyltransferase [Saprospiraceae bacterium]MDW8229775.1 DNA methyltransferase [Saprospiraceae bacterium]